MDVLYYIIFLPIIAGIVLFIFPEKMKPLKGSLSLIISAFILYLAYQVYFFDTQTMQLQLFVDSVASGTILHSILDGASKYFTLNIDSLSRLIILFTSIFGFLISIYSLVYVTPKKQIYNYYPFFLITLGCTIGAILADNLLLFLFFWGVLGFTLYKLIKGKDEESSAAAKKTLIIIGSSDGIMILGIAIIWQIAGSLNISELNIATNSSLATAAFITLLIGSFAKAGAFPFHTWIPDYSQKAPASSAAFLPASLDKLLGIYFLTRLCIDMFTLNEILTLILLIIGVLTIIFAVMMALIQHNFKRLLGFHAVSQVGYMIVGIVIATPLGIAAGLFHMINNTLYKSGLFLSAGSVIHRTGKENLDETGGLSKNMPITFFSALIFALAISGIPPFNGFASKWMIYQGIIDFGEIGTGIASQLWIVWLALAVLGSALTLASFIKFISGIFLGSRKKEFENIKEVNILMWLPKLILALICIALGVFATTWAVPKLFHPYVGEFNFTGIWQSSTVSLLIVISIILGIIIYLIGNIKNMRTAESFIGGEKIHEDTGFRVTEFYNTIRELKPLKGIYERAEKRWFDLYDLLKHVFYGLHIVFSKMHTGVLTTYAIWIFAGFVIIVLCLL
ncbi:MAG: proton-conducting transporter membrane subunit [Bacteroidales bacterium]